MNTIIEKIRAEVNKLPEKYKGMYKQFGDSLGFIDGLDEVKKILSDLEKECSIPNDLEKYASRAGFDYVDNIAQEYPGHRFNDHDVEFAYRDGILAGAKWQEEQDNAISRQAEATRIKTQQMCYEKGQADMKEQMMKGAIDAEFCSAGMFMPMIDFKDKRMKGIKYGDTIKVIVIKEK